MKDTYPRVPYGMTVHGSDEINEVIKVLNSSTQMGPKVMQLEEEVAKIFSKKYGLMVNSGTSALMLGVECLGLTKGSNVITPALTFGTTVSSIVKNGLVPNFVDVKKGTFCIDEEKIAESIDENTSAILAPDLLGNVCNWKKIREIANKFKLKVIVDSADTLGASLDGKSTGEYADLIITSFYGSHIINGAGNGGLLATSDNNLFTKATLLRSWGRSSSIFKDSEAIENRFNIDLEGIDYDAKFIFSELGYQLEPSEMSAAFALVQLKKLSENFKLRNNFFNSHNQFFKKYSDYFDLPLQNPNASTCWLAYPLIIKNTSTFTRKDLQIFLEKRNIQTRVIFTGNVLRQPMMKEVDYIGEANNFYEADNVMKNGILIACHHGLTEEMIKHIYSSFDVFMESK